MGTILMLVALCVCVAGAIYFWRLIGNNDPDSWVNSGVNERKLVILAGILAAGAIVLIVQLASSVVGSDARVADLSGEKSVAAEIVCVPCRCSCENVKPTAPPSAE